MRNHLFLLCGLLAPTAASLGAQSTIPRLRAIEDMRIDGTEHELTSVARVVILLGGSVALAGMGDTRVAFFLSNGALAGTFGRSGGGPGEFRQIVHMGTLGDTLWVNDPRLSRLTLIGPERSLLRTIDVPRRLVPPTQSRAQLGAPVTLLVWGFRGDRFTGTAFAAPEGPPEWLPARAEASALVVSGLGGEFRTLLAWTETSTDCRISYTAGALQGSFGIPFCAVPLRSFAQDGSFLAFLQQENHRGGDAEFRVALVRSTGDTVFERRIPYTPVPVDQRSADSALARLKGFRGGPMPGGLPPQVLAAIDGMRIPNMRAPAHAIVVGMDGAVWIGLERGEPNGTWLGLLPNGATLGELQLPRNTDVITATTTMLWAVETDEAGVPSVVRYRVVR